MIKILRLGLIGAGHRQYFASSWNNTNKMCKITALAETDNLAIKNYRSKIDNDVFVTKDYKQLLARKDIDAVIVMTPDYLHEQHAVDVLHSGKHLYLEKPMATTIDGCDNILASLKNSGKKMMIGFNMRHMGIYQKMKDIIDKGQIGDVKAIWVRHFVGSGGRMYYQDWHRNSEYSNSLLVHKGSHDIDMIHMLGNSYTKKVSAFGGLDFYNKEEHFTIDNLVHKTDSKIDVEDNSVMIMELDNGVKGAYLQNHFTPDYSRNYTVIGTKGRIESDDVNSTIKLYSRNHTSNHSDIVYKMKTDDTLIHDGADPGIVNSFVDYILFDKAPLASPMDGRMSVASAIKATESMRDSGHMKYIPKVAY